jgi:hypothetical protein
MAVFDLSDITRTLIWMIETGIPALDGWPVAVTASVSPLPPDRLVDGGTDLGLYLYHVAEDAHYKNPAPDGGGPASRPLALNLYFQLTAQVGNLAADAFRAQQLMGAAVRVLHDFPLIVDSTTLVDSAGVVHNILSQRGLQGRDNRIRVTLRPVPVDDAVDYWTAGDAPLRLAAYYQAAVILLESEPPPTVAPRVLTYGSGVFVTGAPILTGSRAILSIVVGRDTTASHVTVQPAQVSIRERFELIGTALTGTGTTLQLRDDRGPRTVDASSWAVVATPERVFATPTEALGDGDLLPGTWSASVVVMKTIAVGRSLRPVTHSSNETPIMIVPSLDETSATGPTLGSAAAGAAVTWSGWLFQHPDIPTDDNDARAVHVFLDQTALVLDTDGTLDPGEFTVTDPRTLDVRLPSDLVPGSMVAVRVGVRGAWSSPRWLGVT